MAIDVIVFSQKELDSAVRAGNKSICLCDGVFLLPSADDITYTTIGDVTVIPSVMPTSASSFASSYITSYVTSYVTSYITSYVTSYKYEYEYEYTSSGSFVTSFLTSYTTSFRTSFIEHAEECIWVNGYGINLI